MERKTVYHKSSSPVLHNPSFSSSLLDSIYRSIDKEGGVKVPEEMVFYKGLTVSSRKNRPGSPFREKGNGEDEEVVEKRMMEYWRRSAEKGAATTGRKSSSAVLLSSNSNSSSSSSSDSSFWSGGSSSSESESFYCPKSTSSSSSSSWQRPKPVRTERDSKASSSQKPKKHHDHEEVLAKTVKSKALKIYAELKKAKSKQPISPGNRLASFLNSLFTDTKKKTKSKMTTKTVSEPFGRKCDEISRVKYTKSNSTPASYPSSASSYTRSCLSKTLAPSSGGKAGSNNNSSGKRSVRFDPVSVIVDEDSRPCGRKNLREEDKLKIHMMEENRRVAEAASKLLESYRRTKSSYDGLKDRGDDLSDDEDEDIDHRESCSSSDLFELDNLLEIGIDRFREELPVYETTHINTNRAIASGLIP